MPTTCNTVSDRDDVWTAREKELNTKGVDYISVYKTQQSCTNHNLSDTPAL
jgi:hypothetical protein